MKAFFTMKIKDEIVFVTKSCSLCLLPSVILAEQRNSFLINNFQDFDSASLDDMMMERLPDVSLNTDSEPQLELPFSTYPKLKLRNR